MINCSEYFGCLSLINIFYLIIIHAFKLLSPGILLYFKTYQFPLRRSRHESVKWSFAYLRKLSWRAPKRLPLILIVHCLYLADYLIIDYICFLCFITSQCAFFLAIVAALIIVNSIESSTFGMEYARTRLLPCCRMRSPSGMSAACTWRKSIEFENK